MPALQRPVSDTHKRSAGAGSRGPNALRRQATREKLLGATVECLHRYGYFGTSTVLVTEMAGVSRGSLLHQFPTKVDLMAATAEHVSRQNGARLRETLAAISDLRERFRAVPRVSWEVISSPSGIAFIEIALAARSEPGLSDRMTPLVQRIEVSMRDSLFALVSGLGVQDRSGADTLTRVHIATLRGLAIEAIYNPQSPDPSAALARLSKYNDSFLEELIAG